MWFFVLFFVFVRSKGFKRWHGNLTKVEYVHIKAISLKICLKSYIKVGWKKFFIVTNNLGIFSRPGTVVFPTFLCYLHLCIVVVVVPSENISTVNGFNVKHTTVWEILWQNLAGKKSRPFRLRWPDYHEKDVVSIFSIVFQYLYFNLVFVSIFAFNFFSFRHFFLKFWG